MRYIAGYLHYTRSILTVYTWLPHYPTHSTVKHSCFGTSRTSALPLLLGQSWQYILCVRIPSNRTGFLVLFSQNTFCQILAFPPFWRFASFFEEVKYLRKSSQKRDVRFWKVSKSSCLSRKCTSVKCDWLFSANFSHMTFTTHPTLSIFRQDAIFKVISDEDTRNRDRQTCENCRLCVCVCVCLFLENLSRRSWAPKAD